MIKFPQSNITIPLFYKETDINGHFQVSADFGPFQNLKFGSTILDVGLDKDKDYLWYVDTKCLSFCNTFGAFFSKNYNNFFFDNINLDFVFFFEIQIFYRKN